jgi:hypothetical protein
LNSGLASLKPQSNPFPYGKRAARKLAQLPESGQLNLAGLQTVLDLRVQFGLTAAMGKDLARYYDESFYGEAHNQ